MVGIVVFQNETKVVDFHKVHSVFRLNIFYINNDLHFDSNFVKSVVRDFYILIILNLHFFSINLFHFKIFGFVNNSNNFVDNISEENENYGFSFNGNYQDFLVNFINTAPLVDFSVRNVVILDNMGKRIQVVLNIFGDKVVINVQNLGNLTKNFRFEI